MTNIRDWNVSRQLWWGHRIPAWYCPDGHVTVTSAPDGPDACEVCRPTGAASSSRTPTSSTPGSARACGRSRPSAGPTRPRTSRRYYPGTVMETGYDILFFWVARMMMLGLHLTDAAPFRDRLPVGPDPRPVRPEDVEDEGQHRRPAGHDRRARRRRPAVRPRPRHDAGQRPAVRAGQGRERPQLRQQAVERDPVRARRPARDDRRRRGTAPPGRDPPRARPTAGCCRVPPPPSRPWTARWPTSTSARSRGSCTTRSGASTATGASSSPRCASRTTTDARRRARGDLVGAGRGARHVPAPAPPGDAVHHRAAVAGAAAPRRATRTC